MKTSNIVWAVVIVIILAGGWYIWMQSSTPAPVTSDTTTPSTNMGLNGSANQGNLGGANTGTPQTPSSSGTTGDGTGVSQNLILGITAGSGAVTNFLSAYNGMTVYTYSPDTATPGKSSCTGTCATIWPPYTVSSASDINVPANISGHVGTITRANGTLQVTYNGMPLYFYSKDSNPGDANGQGVGGVWYVVKA